MSAKSSSPLHPVRVSPHRPGRWCGLTGDPERPGGFHPGRDVHPPEIGLDVERYLVTTHQALRPLPEAVDEESEERNGSSRQDVDDDCL